MFPPGLSLPSGSALTEEQQMQRVDATCRRFLGVLRAG
jgi:hypothetical protein